jgi:hypothetical protein
MEPVRASEVRPSPPGHHSEWLVVGRLILGLVVVAAAIILGVILAFVIALTSGWMSLC